MYQIAEQSLVLGSVHGDLQLFDRAYWQDFSHKDTMDHFASIDALFSQRVAELSNELHYVTDESERELLFMLEALLHVKRQVQENADE